MRRSRRRFWEGDPAAFWTLHTCLVGVSKLLAPLIPFVTDEIYDNLDGTEPSVHLCDWPEAGERDERLEWQMDVARDAVELGRSARAQAKIKVRQPLAEAVIVAGADEREAIERFRGLVLDELNVREVRFVSDADELGRWELKPNYRALGPRFGKHMPQVAAAVAGLDPARVRSGDADRHLGRRPRAHAGARRRADGATAAGGLPARARGTHAVALNLELDEDLRREGLAREIVHAVQAARKDAGLGSRTGSR